MSSRIRPFTKPLAGLVFFSTAAFLQACPVCFAAPDSPESRGMTMAILFLLGTIGVVLCGVASFVMYLVAHQKQPLPAHVEFVSENPAGHSLQPAHQ